MANNQPSRLTTEMKAILAVMGDEPVLQREFYRLGVVPLLRSNLVRLKELASSRHAAMQSGESCATSDEMPPGLRTLQSGGICFIRIASAFC
jgi:hypothetical protein